jgi:hypothetical protein
MAERQLEVAKLRSNEFWRYPYCNIALEKRGMRDFPSRFQYFPLSLWGDLLICWFFTWNTCIISNRLTRLSGSIVEKHSKQSCSLSYH